MIMPEINGQFSTTAPSEDGCSAVVGLIVAAAVVGLVVDRTIAILFGSELENVLLLDRRTVT